MHHLDILAKLVIAVNILAYSDALAVCLAESKIVVRAKAELSSMNDLRLTVVVPVYNAERVLRSSVQRLNEFLTGFSRRFEIVISNNGSTDQTLEIATQLRKDFANVKTLHSVQRGRGGALKRAWVDSQSDILSYMDVDLSTDLGAFRELIRPLTNGEKDVATGSRLLKPEWTKRSLKRTAISRIYNILLKLVFRTNFSDAQCGFKAITKSAAAKLVPLLESDGWFMDTELLVLAEKLGYRILDVPVRWVENPDSRVKILQTAVEDLRGMWRLHRSLASGKYGVAQA